MKAFKEKLPVLFADMNGLKGGITAGGSVVKNLLVFEVAEPSKSYIHSLMVLYLQMT